MTTAIWKSEPALMRRAREAQNHPANVTRDEMTIIGFFTAREELTAHVEKLEARAAR